jgi:hypothetical protein
MYSLNIYNPTNTSTSIITKTIIIKLDHLAICCKVGLTDIILSLTWIMILTKTIANHHIHKLVSWSWRFHTGIFKNVPII